MESPNQGNKTGNEARRCRVLCVGNALLADEGLGPAVAAWLLQHYDFPAEVEVIDCGTMGLALLPYFEDGGLVVVVDAVDGTGYEPGTVVRFKADDIADRSELPSAHDMRVSDVLAAARLLGREPEVECVGVQVAQIHPAEFTLELTPQVAAAVETAAQTVLALLARAGFQAVPRPDGEGESR